MSNHLIEATEKYEAELDRLRAEIRYRDATIRDQAERLREVRKAARRACGEPHPHHEGSRLVLTADLEALEAVLSDRCERMMNEGGSHE